ncbi:MAG TPA: enoyl-CoA hydratase/isomerase family protein [Mycobacteriales bacterium]|jgi:enoyl-CoA hydratase/carnithine racemase|nr:enoyl-CoA hydratase/isomerase family protein [Mycobacteriales bacterium]
MGSATAVELVDTDGVRRIRFNRPDKLNALNPEIRDALWTELNRLVEDPRTRVLVISGNGRAFSSGVDLGSAGDDRESGDWASERLATGRWQRILDLLEQIPQVTVASLHGHCIGGAALIAASCDLRIGADDLQMRIPELELGIPLTWGGLPRLQREIGLPLTRDLVMTGRALSAEEALRAGFIQRLAALDQLPEATDQLVRELLEMPPAPLAMTRAALSALSRDQIGAKSWADADLLRWSTREGRAERAGE